MTNIKHEQISFLSGSTIVLGAAGFLGTLISDQLLTAAGLAMIFWAVISGLRALFGGLFQQLMAGNNLSRRLSRLPELSSTEAGARQLVKLRRRAFVWSIVFFIFLIVCLSVLIIGIQNSLPVATASSAASLLCTLLFHIHSLYIAVKCDMRLKGKQK